MISIKNALIILILISFSASNAHSQIVTEKYSNGDIKSIVFDKMKVINLLQANPFLNKDLADNIYNSQIEFVNKSIDDIMLIMDSESLYVKEIIALDSLYIYSFPYVEVYDHGVIVLYYLFIQNQYEGIHRCYTQLYVYDTTGELTYDKLFFEYLSDVGFSDDCSTLLVSRTKLVENDTIIANNESLLCINTKEDRKIFEFFSDQDSYYDGIGSENSIVFVKQNFPKDMEIKLYAYCPIETKLYSRSFSFNEYRRIISINNKGISLTDKVNSKEESYKLTYSKDFREEVIP